MPLPLPNLDDRNYAELVEMARGLIPSEAPEWTDHNPSDTGMVLIELFAWLTELLLYRVNQVPEQSQVALLQLLNGPDWQLPEGTTLDRATQQTVLDLRQRYRAATAEDYEQLTLNQWPQSEWAQQLQEPIARVQAFSQRNLSADATIDVLQPGHLSLVILPAVPTALLANGNAPSLPMPSDGLRRGLWTYLESKRLLTTHHHVVGPRYQSLAVTAKLYSQEESQKGEVEQRARAELWKFCHPLVGGSDGKGWPLGRSVYPSEVYRCLDEVPGVDYVQELELNGSDTAVTLPPHGLVQLELEQSTLTLVSAWEINND